MAELPASWGLKTQRRTDGKLDIIGKTDEGQDYRVRTTDTPEVTEKDVSELRAADRENYANPDTRTYDYIKHLTANPGQAEKDARDLDDWTAAAEPVVYAGLERKGSTVGSTAAYRRGWDRIFGEN